MVLLLLRALMQTILYILHKSSLLNVPIDTTSMTELANIVRLGCYMLYVFT